MNFDLIQKLIKLANNNPNENEANLAARKVCKMLVDYTFGQVKTAAAKVGGTWGDVVRSTEPRWSSKPPTGQGNPFYADFDWQEIIRKMKEDQAKQYTYDEEFIRKTNEEQAKRQKEYEYNRYWTGEKEPKPKRPLACKVCGTMIETAFVGVEATFECNSCIWDRYNRGKV